MTQQTVSPLPVLALLGKEPPVDRHPPGVTQNSLDHTPDQQNEKDMEDYEENDVRSRLEEEHILKDKDVVVEEDETTNPDEVRIYESTTTHRLKIL